MKISITDHVFNEYLRQQTPEKEEEQEEEPSLMYRSLGDMSDRRSG